MTETQAIGPAIPGNRLLRLTAFLFGGVAYLTFLFTILYAVRLVSGLVVSKSIVGRSILASCSRFGPLPR
jgi:phage-related holin